METNLYKAYIAEGHAINHKVGNVVKHDFLSFWLDLAHKLVEDQYVEKADHDPKTMTTIHVWIERTTGL